MTGQIPELRAALAEVGDPERAAQMAGYMKDRFEFFGVASPARRATQKPILTAAKGADQQDLLAFAEACWAEPKREFHYVAADVLRKHNVALSATALARVQALITTNSWWDTVDSLAAWTVGPLVLRHPQLTGAMDKWISDKNIWLARTAIIHQLSYKDQTDPDRLFAYAVQRAEDTEFFIRKALGWALRQYARVDPEAVAEFVAANPQLSGLTKREALKHL